MDSLIKLNSFLTQIHADGSSNFNFGTVTLHMHRILNYLNENCPGAVECLTIADHVHDPTHSAMQKKQWYFGKMIKFITVCTKLESLKPYTRHLLSVFEYMNNDSVNMSIAPMSQSEPYINIKFKMNNVYRTMCSPRRFLNQIKNSTSAVDGARSFRKYEKLEFVKDISDLVRYAMSSPEGILETRAAYVDIEAVLEAVNTDDTDDCGAGCINERDFEEVLFKKMYRYISEVSLQAEIYAANNTPGIGSAHAIFMGFKVATG